MVAMATEPPATKPDKPSKRLPRTVRELFDALPPLPGLRVEVIEGNLIVSPAGSPEHFRRIKALDRALIPLCDEHGWEGTQHGPSLCIEGPRDSLCPDYVVWSPDCKRWGDELLSYEVIMAAEVVSPSSVRIDREDKVRLYAVGKLPIYLLIDPIAKSPTATVHSDIKDGEYRTVTSVAIGKPLYLPAPLDFELDTSIFTV
ncbi:Uma2 family endonuclease [Nonomuraea turkmeniaca]|uniref:Uma2 family endonuclease n=2 Tax=Nonomuraea turkmeniaca TaxID=103838 RepID=A0A5S4FSJ6_9ACTN|nr:Uma2 family endonuclease [Nonomuraea turkmeniaca]